jgi:hypothetical protein
MTYSAGFVSAVGAASAAGAGASAGAVSGAGDDLKTVGDWIKKDSK